MEIKQGEIGMDIAAASCAYDVSQCAQLPWYKIMLIVHSGGCLTLQCKQVFELPSGQPRLKKVKRQAD